MKMSNAAKAVAGVTLVALLATGCSTAAPEEQQARVGSDGVAMGPGVTDDTIKLGIIADRTGPFADNGNVLANATQAYYDQVNEAGGICNRQIDLTIRDGGYDVQQTVTEYAQIKDDVLGLPKVLGGPHNAALLDSYARDNMLAIPGSWASTLLTSENLMFVGSAYEYWVINAVDYLVEQGQVERGGKVGVIHLEGETGAAVLHGAELAAPEYDLQLVSQEVAPGSADMGGVVSRFNREGVSAIIMVGPAPMTAQVAGAAQATGLNVPLVTLVGGYNPGLLNTAVGDWLQEHLYVALSYRMDASEPEVANLIERYETAYPDTPINESGMEGFASAALFGEILQSACDSKDLTREGVLKAFRQTTEVDALGLLVPLDYSRRGVSPSRSVFIHRPDANAPGGEKPVSAEAYTGPSAQKIELG